VLKSKALNEENTEKEDEEQGKMDEKLEENKKKN
jgi:hypothetical protein